MKIIQNSGGFTLIELVIVIVLIGTFATIALPRYANLSSKAKVSASKAALGTIRSAIMLTYSSRMAMQEAPAVPTSVFPSMFQDSQVPVEPQSSSNSVTFVGSENEIGDGSGWAYDSVNGRAWINNSQFTDY